MNPAPISIAGGRYERELDRLWLNGQLMARNLANVNTPGYQGVRLAPDPETGFPALIRQELAKTNPLHLALPPDPAADFVQRPAGDLSPDTEMAEFAKNQMFYQSLLEVVNRRDRMARTALEGR